MKYGTREIVLWVAAYMLLAILPIFLAYSGPVPPPRPFLAEFAVGLGFVGLTIMGLQFLLTGRFKGIASTLGLDVMLHFHRQIGLIAFFFILVHPMILIATDPVYLEFLDPRVSVVRALALSSVMGALVLLIVTSIWRQQIGLKYEVWRIVHGSLASFVIFIGVVHIFQVGHYVSVLWKEALWIGLGAAAILLLVNTRLIRPAKLKRTPYRITNVIKERASSWTLVLEPDGHRGMTFLPGQFVWLTVKDSPYSFQQHPFSMVSSAANHDELRLTIKELGDFTETVGEIQPGSRAFLDGPYGAFTLDTAGNSRIVFLVGGVGITPVMSMLRTFQDLGDSRRCLLIYANPNWEDVLFRDELDEIHDDINLKIVHVISDPPPDWDGESGRITPELLDRYLDEPDEQRCIYYVCGPPAMMDAIEPALRERCVPLRDIFSERFEIV